MIFQNKTHEINILKSILYGFLLLIPGYYFANELYLLLFPIAVVLLEQKKIHELFQLLVDKPLSKPSIVYFWFPTGIILFSFLNKLLNGQPALTIKDWIEPYLLLPLLLFTASFILNKYVVRTLVIILSIEIIVALFEYFSNVRSFFMPFDPELIIHSKSLLYNSRVFGFISNSSVFASKIFCIFLLLNVADFKKLAFYSFSFLLTIGIALTFNRTVILAFIFLLFSIVVIHLFHKIKKHNVDLMNPNFIFSCFILLFLLIFNSQFIYQFSRGGLEEMDVTYEYKNKPPLTEDQKQHFLFKESDEFQAKGPLSSVFIGETSKINASGRNLIWANYLYYIENHLLFGNGSDKLMLVQYIPKSNSFEKIHAHNSFLMLVSSNGVLISFIYFIWLFLLWNWKNGFILISILIYSLFQYGIFWAYSFLDVIFVSLLISSTNIISIGYKRLPEED